MRSPDSEETRTRRIRARAHRYEPRGPTYCRSARFAEVIKNFKRFFCTAMFNLYILVGVHTQPRSVFACDTRSTLTFFRSDLRVADRIVLPATLLIAVAFVAEQLAWRHVDPPWCTFFFCPRTFH